MSKININKNSIIYNDIISSVDETGLLLDGGNWKINRDGSSTLTLSNYLPLTGGTITGNTYIQTDNNLYDTLKGKTLLDSGQVYFELLDAGTYGSFNSQLGLNVLSGITWSRNHLKGNDEKYETQTQLKDSGYYLYTKNTTTDKMDSIYLQAGQLELVNHRVTDTSHAEGQVNLSTTSLYITNGNNQVNLSCDPSNIQLYLAGANQNIRLNKDGLTFNGSDIPVESLYFSKDGIGYTNKETYNRQVAYYLTPSGTNIKYKNQSETGTLTFKPDTVDGEVQFKIANTINENTQTVTIYNGHTSTTQTSFNNNDYITKSYVDTSIGNYLPLTGGTLTGSLNINTTSTANDSFAIADLSDTAIRAFNVGNDLSYSYKTVTSGQVSAERKFEVGYNKFEYSDENNQLKISVPDIIIKTSANNCFENKLSSGSYMNFYNNDYNCLYMGTSPNTSNNMIDWIVAEFKLQLKTDGSLYKQANGFNSTLTSTSYNAQFSSAGSNLNNVSINGTNITWNGAQKASYSNPNYDTVDFRINQNGFDYTGNWYANQSATTPTQLRIYSGTNNALLYINHNVPNESNNYISISRESNDTTISMGCNNGSNYSSVVINSGSISLNKGLDNSFTHFSAGNGNLEISKDNTGFRFNLTDTSKTKGLTAFKINGVDVNFTIEGFHDIINDKFTLSNTYDTTATGQLTQDEIDWIDNNSNDILALILDIKRSGSGTDVVTRAEYNDLLNAYNDLADRLSVFLEATGNIENVAENTIKTAAIDNISFTITNQNADDNYSIDWGDGNIELSDKGTLSHTYDTADNYIIKINSNNENATGTLSHAKNQIIEMDIDTIGIPDIDDDDTITKIIVDNNVMYQGSWGDPFIQNADAISEIHIKENCVINTCYPLCQNCPNLVKVIMDAEIKWRDNYLFKNCPNLTEVHLTNTTMPVFGELYSLFDTIPNDLQIYVPNDLVNDYKTALPDYVNYIISE